MMYSLPTNVLIRPATSSPLRIGKKTSAFLNSLFIEYEYQKTPLVFRKHCTVLGIRLPNTQYCAMLYTHILFFLHCVCEQVDKNLRQFAESAGEGGATSGRSGSHAGVGLEDQLLENYLDQAYVECLCEDDDAHRVAQEAQVVSAASSNKLREADEKVGPVWSDQGDGDRSPHIAGARKNKQDGISLSSVHVCMCCCERRRRFFTYVDDVPLVVYSTIVVASLSDHQARLQCVPVQTGH